jgi:pseudomonalisin
MRRFSARSRRGKRAAFIAGAAALTLTAGASSAAASTPNWVSTATRAVTPAHAQMLGAASASTPLHLTVGMAMQDRSGLDALIRAQQTPGNPQYHHYLTPSEFRARFAPSAATTQQVVQYLRSMGLTNVTVAPNRLQVTAEGTVGQAQRAFNTHINQARQSGRNVLVNSSPAQVPATLAHAVTGVLGLSTLGAQVKPLASLPMESGHFPKDFQTIYNAAGTATGSATSIAIIAEGNLAPTIADLRTAEAKQNLPQVPVQVIPVGPSSSDTSAQLEWDLDSQTATGVAQTVRNLAFYDASSLSDSDVARAVNAFAADDTAQAGSASLGECDALAFADGAQIIDDEAFAEAAAQGQSFFASSGDTGASCAIVDTNGVPDSGPVSTNYPASSTYVTGVGGTTLFTDSTGHYQNEIAWNAGGGGISLIEQPGSWQANADPVTPPVGLTTFSAGRGVPDIALDADPGTGAVIYNGTTTTEVGGTSLSSPLALGAWARLESGHGNALGFASPALYGLYNKANSSALSRNATPGFHDITVGTNGLYPATPGWDFTTGIGSFDLTALNQQLR